MAEFIEKYQNLNNQVVIKKDVKNQGAELAEMIAKIVPKSQYKLIIKGVKK